MTPPKTLLELAGAKLTPPPLGDAALVLIDAQREYLDGKLRLSGVEAALEQAGRLLEAARAAGAAIIHIRQRGRPGGLFDPATPTFEIVGEVAPRKGEGVIDKALPNSFAGSALDDTLKRLGRKQLGFAGFMTHMCVSATARAALDLGYWGTVVASACATRDLPDGRGGAIAAADLHRMELAALADRFALVVSDVGAFR
jgi:nicotinamidase-related amidase